MASVLNRRRRHRRLVIALGVAGLSAAVSQQPLLELAFSRATDATRGDRVAAARARLGTSLVEKAAAAGVAWPPGEVFLRAFKVGDDGVSAGRVELWAGDGRAPLALVMTHPLCALSGHLGPKRAEGDLQVPEGFYTISALNPKSSYHLSLRVDYPNASDRIRGRVDRPHGRLGGDIMVHGNCVTIGCLPIQDEPIEEVYLMVAEVHGRRRVAMHIFPRALDPAGLAAVVETDTNAATRALWNELAAGYRAFESNHRVPRVDVDTTGAYIVRATP